MRCGNGNFSFSLVSCSSFTLFQAGKNASHPDKRLSAYLPAHTCTALYMPLLFQPMKRIRSGFQHAPHFVGVLDEAHVHTRESGKHLLHAEKENLTSDVSRFPFLLFSPLFQWNRDETQPWHRPARFQKQALVIVWGSRGEGRKEGSAQEVCQNGKNINWQPTQTNTCILLECTVS